MTTGPRDIAEDALRGDDDYQGPERRSPDRRERTPEGAESPWPRRTTVYLTSDKETMFERAQEIGLATDVEGVSWGDTPAGKFRYALYEVTFELEVSEDGSYSIMSATDGQSTCYRP